MEALLVEEEGPASGTIIHNGKLFWIDHQGGHVRDEMVKPKDKVEDQAVRKIMKFAKDLSAQVARFRTHTMGDLAALDELLAEQYGFVKKGHRGKGNRTYMTFDGLQRVSVQIAQFMDFGPELHIAKAIIDEMLIEWTEGAPPELQAIVTNAFHTDQEGKVNRTEILKLTRLNIDNPRWKSAMDAIHAAQRPRGSKEYVRFGVKDSVDAPWTSITIDLANT